MNIKSVSGRFLDRCRSVCLLIYSPGDLFGPITKTDLFYKSFVVVVRRRQLCRINAASKPAAAAAAAAAAEC